MKTNILGIALFLAFIPISIFAQKSYTSNIAFEIKNASFEDNKYHARSLKDCLKNILDDDYCISYNAFMILSANSSTGDIRTIEGMETYTYADMNIELEINNTLLKEKKTFTFTSKGKASDENSAKRAGLKNVCSDKKIKNQVKTFIAEYLTDLGETRCSEIIDAIKKLKDQKKFSEAIMALDFISDEGTCSNEKGSLEKEILNAQQQYVCNKIIQECSILVNSTKAQHLEQAIYKLLKVQPNTPCADEAIALAKQIGERQIKIEPKAKERLDNQIIILNGNNQSEWRSAYRKQYYDVR